MRLVCVPEELTPLYLLDVHELPVTFRNVLYGDIHEQITRGRFEEALAALQAALAVAVSTRDRQIATLIPLYQADIYRRLQRWEEALTGTQQTLQWLDARGTRVMAYNRAVAQAFEGLIHFVLRADEKASRAFTDAQAILVESERYWGFEHDLTRVADCRNLTRWMSNLMALRADMPPGELVVVVPVYELINNTPVRTGVMTVAPFQVLFPGEALRDYLPSHLVPVDMDSLPFLQLRPDAHYLAIKIPADGDFAPYSRVGDVLLMEAVSPVPLTREVVLSSDAPFVRRTDGRVLFCPRKQETESFVGIPRVLIREEDSDE